MSTWTAHLCQILSSLCIPQFSPSTWHTNIPFFFQSFHLSCTSSCPLAKATQSNTYFGCQAHIPFLFLILVPPIFFPLCLIMFTRARSWKRLAVAFYLAFVQDALLDLFHQGGSIVDYIRCWFFNGHKALLGSQSRHKDVLCSTPAKLALVLLWGKKFYNTKNLFYKKLWLRTSTGRSLVKKVCQYLLGNILNTMKVWRI